jgi:hypothetical protein
MVNGNKSKWFWFSLMRIVFMGLRKGGNYGLGLRLWRIKKKKLCLLGFVMDFNDDGSCAAAGLRNPLSVLMIFMNS